MIGTAHDATTIAQAHEHDEPDPAGWTHLGRGQHREVWLAPSGVVYKAQLGWATSANETEHNTLHRHRETGAPWATPCDLWTVTIIDTFGEPTQRTVVAMEYIVADGTEPDPHLYNAAVAASSDLNFSDNIITRGGIPYLIDAAGL